MRNAIKEGLKKNAESGFYRVRWAEMFPTLVSSIAQTRVRKSQQLVKRLRSCCFHHYMLYLSRSNISCFTVRCITVQNTKLERLFSAFNRPYVFISFLSILLNKSPISNVYLLPGVVRVYIQSVYTGIGIGKQHFYHPPIAKKKKRNPNIWIFDLKNKHFSFCLSAPVQILLIFFPNRRIQIFGSCTFLHSLTS